MEIRAYFSSWSLLTAWTAPIKALIISKTKTLWIPNATTPHINAGKPMDGLRYPNNTERASVTSIPNPSPNQETVSDWAGY